MTVSDEAIEARALLARIPRFGEIGAVERLGGLTNRVFRFDSAAGSYCLRIPGKGTEDYIDRANEAQAAWETARTGVSPALIYFDHGSGVMVTRFVQGARTMSPVLFGEREGAPARAALALRNLHLSGAKFNNRFGLFEMIDSYLKLLAAKDATLPAGYHDVVREAESIRRVLDANPVEPVACHCDPLCENFLDTGSRMWIVDWEYSGMNDPLWDLGDLAVEAGFDRAQEEEMLRAYFDGEPRPASYGRMVIHKAMCDLLWTLWGLIQHANANPADDFWAYAMNRFARCKALMVMPEFARHVAAVEKG